jgi:nucleoside-diphosphate-sugar epimerase
MAFIHDFSDIERNVRVDREAIAAMLDALAGTDKPFVGTNGTLQVAGLGRVAVETDRAPAGPGLHGRSANEHFAIDAAARGIRTSVVRLPPTVHGAGDKGFIPMIIGAAREKGAAAYIGDGDNVWPAVHRLDAARLYRRAIEHAPAGSVLHAVGEQGVTWREIADTIAHGTGLPTKRLAAADAGAHFGWMAMVVGANNPASSEATKQLLGWAPSEPGLIADMRAHYFG